MDFQEYLEEFYARYNVGLFVHRKGSSIYVHVPPLLSSFRLVGTGYDGRENPLLSLSSPERLANEGIFTQQELYDERSPWPMKRNC